MHKDLRVLIAVSAAILFLPSLALAGDKPPTPYDRTRAGYVSDGRQNCPFVLRGGTIDWNSSCNKGQAADCLKLAKAFEGGAARSNPIGARRLAITWSPASAVWGRGLPVPQRC